MAGRQVTRTPARLRAAGLGQLGDPGEPGRGRRAGPRSSATTRCGPSSGCCTRPTGDWGPMYRAVQDPLISLAYVAASPTDPARLRGGQRAVLLPDRAGQAAEHAGCAQRRPAGRRPGPGLGARRSSPPSACPSGRRGARAEEFVRCLQAIWTERRGRVRRRVLPGAAVPGRSRSRCSNRTRRCCSAAAPSARCAGSAGSPTAGSAPAGTTCAASAPTSTLMKQAGPRGRSGSGRAAVHRARGAEADRRTGAGRRRPLHGSADQIRQDLADAGRAGCHRGVPRSELRPAGRFAGRRPGCLDEPGRARTDRVCPAILRKFAHLR